MGIIPIFSALKSYKDKIMNLNQNKLHIIKMNLPYFTTMIFIPQNK